MLSNENEELCPKCKSENIEPQGGAKSIIGKFALFIVMASVGFFTTDIILKKDNTPLAVDKEVTVDEVTDKVPVLTDNTETEGVTTIEEIIMEPTLEPIDSAVFTLANMTLKQDGFSFIVQCKNIPVDYQVELYKLYLNENDTEPFMVAEANGQFSNNNYVSKSGKYYVQATFMNKNHTTLKPIEGIKRPETPTEELKIKKMEEHELEAKINKSVEIRTGGDPANQWYKKNKGDKRIYYKSNITVKANNSVENENRTWESLEQFIGDIRMMGEIKVKVISVSHNKDNIIDAFEIGIYQNE